jgi:hypothetical protein
MGRSGIRITGEQTRKTRPRAVRLRDLMAPVAALLRAEGLPDSKRLKLYKARLVLGSWTHPETFCQSTAVVKRFPKSQEAPMAISVTIADGQVQVMILAPPGAKEQGIAGPFSDKESGVDYLIQAGFNGGACYDEAERLAELGVSFFIAHVSQELEANQADEAPWMLDAFRDSDEQQRR